MRCPKRLAGGGFIDGAIESGLREARTVAEALAR
jgi:monoamine oxidase